VTGNSTTVIRGRALLGADLRGVEDAVIVLRGADIVAAGPATDIDGQPRAETVDARGTTLVPGFIDAHVHIGLAAPREVLRGGVTTVRDLGWPPNLIWDLVARSREAEFEGPQVIAAGQMLTASEGYPLNARWAPPGTGRPVRSPAEADEAVAEQAESGAVIIKVALNPPAGPVLNDTVLAAIVGAAHARGLRVTAHIHGLDELHKALGAEVDELAHMLMSPEEIPTDVIEVMVNRRVVIVPTLSVRFGRDRRVAITNLRRFVAAGGSVVYGTDLGNDGPRPGIDAREVGAMARAGMAPRDIVASATVTSARHLSLERTGTIDAGMRADIVALRGDPSVDVKALTRVEMVWREGRLVT
jgi:imidazolonepropionase-like amidohydrolase